MMKMISEFKETWLTALRSGKYQQTRGRLRKSNAHDTFCCLGVLQDIVAPEDWDQDSLDKTWAANNMSGHLVSDFRGRVGLDTTAARKLMEMNDGVRDPNSTAHRIVFIDGSEPKSFGEIADYIEENL